MKKFVAAMLLIAACTTAPPPPVKEVPASALEDHAGATRW
jgi:hypothetical protein